MLPREYGRWTSYEENGLGTPALLFGIVTLGQTPAYAEIQRYYVLFFVKRYECIRRPLEEDPRVD